jgi:hypothetical protein
MYFLVLAFHVLFENTAFLADRRRLVRQNGLPLDSRLVCLTCSMQLQVNKKGLVHFVTRGMYFALTKCVQCFMDKRRDEKSSHLRECQKKFSRRQ